MIYDNTILHFIHRFGTITTSGILYVSNGLKPCVRISVYKKDLAEVTQFVNYLSLKLRVGYSAINENKNALGYSEWASYAGYTTNTEAKIFVYIGNNTNRLEELRYYDEKADHTKVGLLLNYPRCCVSHFSTCLDAEDFVIQCKSSKTVYPHIVNHATFCFNATYFEHVPCSFDCVKTHTIAAEFQELLANKYDTLDNIITSHTRNTLLYTANHGVFLFKKSTQPGYIGKPILFKSHSIIKDLFNINTTIETFEDGFMLNGNSYIKDKYHFLYFE